MESGPCAGCGTHVDWRRAVYAGDGSRWHWRCFHAAADHIMHDGVSEVMTQSEWLAHQKWADKHHDGRGNQKV